MAATTAPSFAPSKITRKTFSRLLSLYPDTVEGVYREKLSKKKKPKNAKSGNSDPNEEALKEFLKLDRWRYETLTEILSGRRDKRGRGEDVFLEKEELVGLMDWKL